MLIWTFRMRWRGMRSAYTNMLDLSRPRLPRLNPIICNLHRLSHSSLIGLVIIIIPVKVVYALYLSSALITLSRLLPVSRSPSLHFFYSASITFVIHPPLLTSTTPASLPFPPLPPAKSCVSRYSYLDAVSRHMSLSFLPLWV